MILTSYLPEREGGQGVNSRSTVKMQELQYTATMTSLIIHVYTVVLVTKILVFSFPFRDLTLLSFMIVTTTTTILGLRYVVDFSSH